MTIALLAALSAAIAIAAGAFGAHGASTPQAAEWLRTGGLYQLIHAVAALTLAQSAPGPAKLMLAGAAIFAVTLYLMAFGAPRWLGAILTTTSGFTSFIAHAGGPPITAYVIPLKLSPVQYTATMAFFFFVVNLCKWIPYGYLGLLDMRNMATSLVLLPIAPIGVWVGVRMARRISEALFYRFLYVGMFLTGAKLLWDGLV